jgi:PhnB protein
MRASVRIATEVSYGLGKFSFLGPGGMIMHAELRIGDSVIFVSDEFPGMSAAPAPGVAPSSYLFLYTPDADTVFNRAVAAGAQVGMPVTDMFWGDRYGKLTAPFGHSLGVATHFEEVSPDDMARRSAEWTASVTKAAAATAGPS